MATNLFIPSPYFSFKWYDIDAVSTYNTFPLENDTNVEYAQQIQCGGNGYQADQGQIQVVSDFVPTCGLYTCKNEFIKDVPLIPINPPILNVSYICYNGEIDFSDVDPGRYYLKITYTDADSTARDWRTYPLDIQIYHPGTQRIEATNTTNDKGVVFVKPDMSTTVIQFRIASIVRTPLVKSDAEDYEDQYNELTQESSIPFVVYTQLIGGPTLLPFWVIEKINLLYSLTNVTIDGQPFAKIAGQDFKPTRSDIGDQAACWEVDIQPNTAYPSDIFVTGDPGDTNSYLNDKMYKKYKNKSADFAITGVITNGINLIRIAIINYNEDVFTMNVGTTPGGHELGVLNIPDDGTDSIDIGKLFKVPTTIYITGIDGTNLDIILDYNDYNSVPIAPPTKTPLFAKNTIYYFEEISTLFADAFDVGSGLGQIGTDWEGCVLADGRNGVPARQGLVVRGWDSLETGPSTRGTEIGADNVTILKANLPAVGLNVVNGDTVNSPLNPGGTHIAVGHNQGTNRDYALQGTGTVPDRGATENMGDGDPMPVIPHSIILPAFYYVGT